MTASRTVTIQGRTFQVEGPTPIYGTFTLTGPKGATYIAVPAYIGDADTYKIIGGRSSSTELRIYGNRVLVSRALLAGEAIDPAGLAPAAPTVAGLTVGTLRIPGRSWEPFQIDAKTFRVGERVEIMRTDETVERGTFAGTIDVGLGTGILIDIDGDEVVYLAREIKAAQHAPILR